MSSQNITVTVKMPKPPEGKVAYLLGRSISNTLHPLFALVIGFGVWLETGAPFLALSISLIYLVLNGIRTAIQGAYVELSNIKNRQFINNIIKVAKQGMAGGAHPHHQLGGLNLKPFTPPTPKLRDDEDDDGDEEHKPIHP